ncbi:MAG: CPBP family intramembrane metalloprotease [Bacteroidetes bacterium]|nr:CPBP family intramembrane metalloprotease [Bacteroidota bacterium]
MKLLSALISENHTFRKALRSIDLQTSVVLIACALLMMITFKFGSRSFFVTQIAPEASALQAWGWWFSVQGVTGFLIPILILLIGFRCKPTSIGLGLGDWKLALLVFALYVPVVITGTWILSDARAFQLEYPHYRGAIDSWSLFWVYHGLFLLYWLGWEYLWRGFILFGTQHTFGIHTIFVQAVPFALLHVDKPTSELALSLLGGILLGALVWRCRSFWIAVPIHAVQMLVLDFWCTLRLRAGVSGNGLESLNAALSAI